MTKRFIVVTNYQAGKPQDAWPHEGGTGPVNTVVISELISGSGIVVVEGEDQEDMFLVDVLNEMAMAKWGGYGLLPKHEAIRLGGDFGIWFSS